MRLRSALSLIAAFVGGAAIGPVLISGFSALGYASSSAQAPWYERNEWYEAKKLVDSYRNNLPRGLIFTSVVAPPDGKECGYNPEDVFPGRIGAMAESRLAGKWNNYSGYFVLDRWRRDDRDEAWISAITQKISQDMSLTKIKMLRSCIDSSVFRNQCMKEVNRSARGINRDDPDIANFSMVGGDQDKVICLFVDGVAARKGLPLPPLAHPTP